MKMHRSVRRLVFAVMILSLSAASFAQIAVGISVRVAPPALPVYTQPVGPGPGEENPNEGSCSNSHNGLTCASRSFPKAE
jgi:hypothetical protein